MDFDTAILLAIPGSFLAFLGLEALFPSRRDMPAVRHWRLIGLAGFAVTIVDPRRAVQIGIRSPMQRRGSSST